MSDYVSYTITKEDVEDHIYHYFSNGFGGDSNIKETVDPEEGHGSTNSDSTGQNDLFSLPRPGKRLREVSPLIKAAEPAPTNGLPPVETCTRCVMGTCSDAHDPIAWAFGLRESLREREYQLNLAAIKAKRKRL